MSHEPLRIDFPEFEAHLRRIFDRLRERKRPILVERDGEIYRLELERTDIWEGYDAERVQEALQASQGMFAGTDREEFLREMHAQREQGANRPT